MNIIENVFLWDKGKGLLNKKNVYENGDIEILSKALISDDVTEEVDNDIQMIIHHTLRLIEVLKTPRKVNQYINAVLIETEDK